MIMGSAICWENYMPLLRQSLYQQNIALYLAPTADARDTWAPLMQTVGAEGRCFVVSANQCQRRKHLPAWIRHDATTASSPDNLAHRSPSTSSSHRRASLVHTTEDGHELALRFTSAVVEDDPFEQSASPIDSAVARRSTSTSVDEEFVSRGGSCIVGPQGQLLRGPLWEVEDAGLLITEADLEDCERGRLDIDVAGSYSRNDSFKLTVQGLSLNPPPI